MKKKLLIALTFLFVFTIHPAFTQKVVKKISNEMCDCLGKIDLTGDSSAIKQETTNCFVNSLFQHTKELKDQMDIDLTRKGDINKFGEILFPSMIKNCDNFVKVIMKQQGGSDQTSATLNATVCKDFQFGKFRYLSENGDTSHYMIRDQNSIKEYDGNGQLLITSKVKWINECEYIATIADIYDAKAQKVISKGEKMEVKMIAIEGNIVVLQCFVKGIYIRLKYKKMDE